MKEINNQKKIIILDDDDWVLKDLDKILTDEGYIVKCCNSSGVFLSEYKKFNADLTILDIELNGDTYQGDELYYKLKDENNLNSEVIILSSEGTGLQGAELMKAGIYDYLEKMILAKNTDLFLQRIAKAIEFKKQNDKIRKHEKERLEFKLENRNLEIFIGESSKIKRIKDSLPKIASRDSKVLIIGDTGTGKEIVANNIHYLSDRYNKKYVKINIMEKTPTLLESEIFGHVKGAFTGAISDKIGILEEAEEGTIFFDEFQNTPQAIQQKLLRVFENRKFRKVGDRKEIDLKARLIFSMNEGLLK